MDNKDRKILFYCEASHKEDTLDAIGIEQKVSGKTYSNEGKVKDLEILGAGFKGEIGKYKLLNSDKKWIKDIYDKNIMGENVDISKFYSMDYGVRKHHKEEFIRNIVSSSAVPNKKTT